MAEYLHSYSFFCETNDFSHINFQASLYFDTVCQMTSQKRCIVYMAIRLRLPVSLRPALNVAFFKNRF